MNDLETGLAASANEPTPDSTPTPESVLNDVFDAPSEPTGGSEPSGTPEPVPAPVAATEQPQTTERPDAAKGEPPREKWDNILANARTKARDEALAEHRDHLEIVAELKRDFPGTLARLLEEGGNDPRFSEAITAKAAALLNAKKQSAKANAEPEPDLQTADGALVYSADQLRQWHKWNQVQQTHQLTEQFKPLQELQHRFEQAQQRTRDEQQAGQIAEKRGASWKTMPFFADHKQAILGRQQELYTEAQGAQGFDPVNGPWELLQRAYAEVVSTQAIPKQHLQQTEQLVASAARKRAGSSSDPAAAAPAQARKPRTVDEALEQAFSGMA